MKKMMIVVGMLLTLGAEAQMKVCTALTSDKNAFLAGEISAKEIKMQLGDEKPAVVVMAECFSEKAQKEEALKGVTSILGKDVVVSMAVYGIYTEAGAKDRNAVGLLALSGAGVTARQALSEVIQNDFTNVAKRLAQKLPVTDDAKLMLVLADCHSPRNQYFLDGLQSVYGTTLPMAGGSANKNTGFNWIGHAGELKTDVGLIIALNGPFKVIQAGDQARDNDAVLKTAEDVAARLRQGATTPLTAALFFDCAGRKGKLESIDEEQAAIAKGLGKGVPFFGIWCAGEIGVANDSQGVPVGRGWHLMATGIYSAGLSQPADGVVGPLEQGLLALGSGRVCLFEKDGTITRTAKTGNNADAWYLENGNILFADGKVTEVDKDGKTVWEYKPDCKRSDGAMSCQRLPNGNTVVGENGTAQVTEVDKDGKVVFTLKIKPQLKKNEHHVMRMCRKLANGNYLVCHSGDGFVREYMPDATVVFEYTCTSIAFAAVRLPNGNTMISSLDQVEEVTPKGEVIWDFKKTDLPELNIRNMTGIHVLKNNNMVIGNYGAYDKEGKGVGMFEITREKKLVWSYVSPGRKDKSMMAVQKLDGDFNPLR